MKKLRILCLHGYHGSAEILRRQMRGLADSLEALAEFVCVDAPSLAAGDFGWWHAVARRGARDEEDPGVGPGARYYKGWERTRDGLVTLFQSRGPFDGIFGFSQGAALAALLVGLRAPDGVPTPQCPLVFGFALIVSGFLSVDANLAQLYASPAYDLPSLHLIGRADGIVSPTNSRRLAANFKNPAIVEHAGGHVVANTPEVCQRAADFLEQRMQVAAGSSALASVTKIAAASAASAAGETDRLPRSLVVPLWPGRAHPNMTLFFPAAAAPRPAPALLIFQGGAYSFCSGSGGEAPAWFANQGMVGVRVEYGTRSSNEFYPQNYADAARALRLVRSRAVEWGIDPHRIGVLGFSAGGHLASLLSTQPDLYLSPNDDLAGQVSARPDLVILAYPVISFVDGYSPGAFVGTAENFFGYGRLSESLRRQFSNELHVQPGHPPVFIWTTKDDGLVPYTHAQLFAEACTRAGVPVAFKLYPHGPHGLGLALDRHDDVGKWTVSLRAWLAERWGLGK